MKKCKNDFFEKLDMEFLNMETSCEEEKEESDMLDYINQAYHQQPIKKSNRYVDFDKIIKECEVFDDSDEYEQDLFDYVELESLADTLDNIELQTQEEATNLWDSKEKEEESEESIEENNIFIKKMTKTPAPKKEMRMANLIAKLIKSEYELIYYNGNLRKYNQIYYERYSEDAFKMDVLMLYEDEENKDVFRGETLSISNLKEGYEFLKLNVMLESREIDLAAKVHKDACKIAFNNGIFDCHKKKLKKHSPKHYVLFCCDATYEPGHMLNDSESFNKLCGAAPKGEEKYLAKLLLEYAGYSMTRIIRKVFLVLGTAPNSGKSIFCDFLRCVLGENNTTNFMLSDFSDKYVMADISNSCLAIAAESEPGFLDKKAVNKIKILTGESTFRTRQIYKESVVLENFCKLIISTNFPIEIRKEDEAFFNRMLIAPFLNSTSLNMQDCDLYNKLLADRDIILSLAADAFAKVIEKNYKFTESPTSLLMKRDWKGRTQSNSTIVLFAEEYLKFDTDESTVTRDIYNKYHDFCENNGYSIEYSHSQFTSELKELYDLEATRKRDPNRDGKSEKALKNVTLKN